jgi:hypothetical protein
VFFGFLKQAVVRIALNSKSSCLSLPSAGIPDVYQHTWHIFNLGELIVWYYNESLSGVATMNPSVQQIYPNFKNKEKGDKGGRGKRMKGINQAGIHCMHI